MATKIWFHKPLTLKELRAVSGLELFDDGTFYILADSSNPNNYTQVILEDTFVFRSVGIEDTDSVTKDTLNLYIKSKLETNFLNLQAYVGVTIPPNAVGQYVICLSELSNLETCDVSLVGDISEANVTVLNSKGITILKSNTLAQINYNPAAVYPDPQIEVLTT